MTTSLKHMHPCFVLLDIHTDPLSPPLFPGPQAKLYPRILAAMKPGATLGLSHGFLLGVMQSDRVDFRKDINVVLVAPKVRYALTKPAIHQRAQRAAQHVLGFRASASIGLSTRLSFSISQRAGFCSSVINDLPDNQQAAATSRQHPAAVTASLASSVRHAAPGHRSGAAFAAALGPHAAGWSQLSGCDVWCFCRSWSKRAAAQPDLMQQLVLVGSGPGMCSSISHHLGGSVRSRSAGAAAAHKSTTIVTQQPPSRSALASLVQQQCQQLPLQQQWQQQW